MAILPTTSTSETHERTIATSRLIRAAPSVAWRACTDPNHLVAWWAPKGFTIRTQSMDLREGGLWHYAMHAPDGTRSNDFIAFRRIDPGTRLTYQHGGDRGDSADFQTTLTFEPRGEQTLVTLNATFPTVSAARLFGDTYGATDGAEATLARLDAHLAKM